MIRPGLPETLIMGGAGGNVFLAAQRHGGLAPCLGLVKRAGDFVQAAISGDGVES